jgi:hypothetical protein
MTTYAPTNPSALRAVIQRSIRDLVENGRFYRVTYATDGSGNPAPIDPGSADDRVVPSSIEVNEVSSEFEPDLRYGRDYKQQRVSWVFKLLLGFEQETTLAFFEQDITDSVPRISPTNDYPYVLLRIKEAEYAHPVRSGASHGTEAVITFQAQVGRQGGTTMPGVNATGQPKTSDYNLGRGTVYFSSHDTNSLPDTVAGYRDLGNAPEFNISIETETLEHQSSRQGLKVTDKEVLVSQKVNLSLTLDEINFENLSSLLSGTVHDDVANTGALTDAWVCATAWTAGRWYDVYTDDPRPGTDGVRVYDLSARGSDPDGAGTIAVSDGTTTKTYPTDADYSDYFLFDASAGRIFLPVGGYSTAAPVTITTNTAGDTPIHEVRGLQATSAVGCLKFVAENPAAGDHRTEYQFHQVSLKAEGDFSLIGDEFSTMSFTAVAESNILADADSPILTVRTVPA